MAETRPLRVPSSTLKDLADRFNTIHDQFEAVKDYVEGLGDESAADLYDMMELHTVAAMRKLRCYLGVPYPQDRPPAAQPTA